MFFIPTAIFYGAPPPLTVSYYIWKSLIPSLLGNIVGGGIMVALPYWYLYLWGEETAVDFNLGPQTSDVAAMAGPLGKIKSKHILQGREMDQEHPASQLPSSGAGFQSAVSRELSEEKFGKKKASDEEEKGSGSDRTAV